VLALRKEDAIVSKNDYIAEVTVRQGKKRVVGQSPVSP